MLVTVDHKFNHSIAKVYKAFTNPEFYLEKFAALGNRNVAVIDTSDDDDGFFIELQREIRLDAPRLLRSVLGEWNKMLQTEHWHEDEDGYCNELEVRSDLVPMEIDGTMSLSGTSKKCVNHIEMSITSKVPLIGRQLEKFAAESTRASLQEEYDFVRDYLSGK